jgi:hypothetical protein
MPSESEDVLVLCGGISLTDQSITWARANDGCGNLLRLEDAYRCVDCTRWYHRRCMAANHFNRALVEAHWS